MSTPKDTATVIADLERLKRWSRAQSDVATIWMHADDGIEAIQRLERHKDYAIRWANQSVDMLKDAFFPVADALRTLEAYLRNTPHHNAPEAAAARKALAVFDRAEPPSYDVEVLSPQQETR